ncbi:uncharacterized protein LOC127856372 [Dreissena polymorpha]|uniref:Uncharacterized protein n=1 Tax=Dreissena polymorpha TaxID=45954 RepID=A0A9D4C4P6_DREPO|nr:uncharacterized protein LOC127856372 [Dreissena polymorpha]KAH3717030.1 hypothetical protein DPMN_059810 [Dreissena polymorpha]
MASRKRKPSFVTPFSQSSQPAVTVRSEADTPVGKSSGKDVPTNEGEPFQMSPLLVGRMQVVTPNMRKKIKRRFACGIFRNGTSLTQESSPGLDVPFVFSQADEPDILLDVHNDLPKGEPSSKHEKLENKLRKSEVQDSNKSEDLQVNENNVHAVLVNDPDYTDRNVYDSSVAFCKIVNQKAGNPTKSTHFQGDKAKVKEVIKTFVKVSGNRKFSPADQATTCVAITERNGPKNKPVLVNKKHVREDKRQESKESKHTSANQWCSRRKKTNVCKKNKFREEEIRYSVLKELMQMHMEINDLQNRRKLLKLPDGYTSINRLLPTQDMKDFPNHAKLFEE